MLAMANLSHRNVCQALLNAQADVNAVDASGWSPLHWLESCRTNDFGDYVHIKRWLEEAGAKSNLQNKNTKTTPEEFYQANIYSTSMQAKKDNIDEN